MKNPINDEKAEARVSRGGGWFGFARGTLVSARSSTVPTSLDDGLGFRLVKNIPRIRNEKSNKR